MNSAIQMLALIPARGGSKGLPGKNLMELCGRPLLSYAVESAMNSGLFAQIIVSTDDERIASAAKSFGASVPFRRPPHLATDDAASMDVVQHAINWCEKMGKRYEYLVLLQPTSPLRGAEDIKQAAMLCLQKAADSVISVTECDHHPLWSNTIPDDGSMAGFLRACTDNKNRQELPRYYRLNGALYMAKWEQLKQRRSWFSERAFAYTMPRERSIDIDNIIDFRLAELLLAEGMSI